VSADGHSEELNSGHAAAAQPAHAPRAPAVIDFVAQGQCGHRRPVRALSGEIKSDG
jgi:hypothetical protein